MGHTTKTPKDLARKAVFTTGEVARFCQVAPRTVTKWFDSGKLRGYRIPGSDDRRVPRDSLVRFLGEYGMPLGPLAEPAAARVLLVGADAALAGRLRELLPEAAGWRHGAADDAFAAGLPAASWRPDAVVVDLALGRAQGLAVARALGADPAHAATLVVALACEDEADEAGLAAGGFDAVFRRPFDVALLAAGLRADVAGRLGL